MSGVRCEGIVGKKRCTNTTLVERAKITNTRTNSEFEKFLCTHCRTSFENAGFSVTVIADVPKARQNIQVHAGPSVPEAWMEREDLK
jgi:hypothetical protein